MSAPAQPPMRALSVRQPWAIAICHGKDVENRSRRVGWTGPVAIHASKAACPHLTGDTIAAIAAAIGMTAAQMAAEDHRGAVVAVARLTGCHASGEAGAGCGRLCSPWAEAGQWHLGLAPVVPLRWPVPARGALGLWRLPPDIEAAVRAACPPAAGTAGERREGTR